MAATILVVLGLVAGVTVTGSAASAIDKPWPQLVGSVDDTPPLTSDQAKQTRRMLWARYRDAVRADAGRAAEHRERQIRYNGKVMRFHFEVVGDPEAGPMPLYIALHGGGGGPARMNDSQYEHMKRYYLPTVKRGIYCATRGVTDTWDLHFRPESYVCYDRLIENMLAFENVDPDRVYIMGFSAGGDGTYQIAARMADRWAGAAMSAGHPNGVNPRNLYNLPLLTQVGEHDGAYDRNVQTVKYHQRILKLRGIEGGGYPHQVNVHAGKPHNFYDNHPKQSPQQVLSDPVAWLERGDRSTVDRNTSSIAWLDQYTRTPQPDRVIWDRTTQAPRGGDELWQSTSHGQQHYWLDVAELDVGEEEIVARLDRERNTIVLETLGQAVRILLTDSMLDLDSPIHVALDGTVRTVKVQRTVGNLIRTLEQRGDPSHMYEAAIVARRGPGVLILSAE